MKEIMKKTIIVSEKIIDSSFQKVLARFGYPTFNMSFFSGVELAKYVLIEHGIVLNKEHISKDELAKMCFSSFRKIDFFKNISLEDALSIICAIDYARFNSKDRFDENILINGEFEDKNSAIIQAYKVYLDLLGEKYIDDYFLILYVIEKKLKTRACIKLLEGFSVPHIVKELAESVCESVDTLYLNKGEIKISEFTSIYGMVNEIEHVIKLIIDNEWKIDECSIALIGSEEYKYACYEKLDVLGIPYSKGVALKLIETNVGKFFSSIIDYLSSFRDPLLLLNIIHSQFFDLQKFEKVIMIDEENKTKKKNVIDAICAMRFGFSESENNQKLERLDKSIYKEYIKKAAYCFNRKIISFIEEYCEGIDEINSEKKALEVLRKETEDAKKFNLDLADIKEYIMTKQVEVVGAEECKIMIISNSNIINYLRPHNFFIGLSANLFPGKPTENPIMLDSDYALFGIKDYSKEVIRKKINDLEYTIGVASSLGCANYLSFANYNSADLKEQTASSFLFGMYKKLHAGATLTDLKDSLVSVGYFDSGLSSVTSVYNYLNTGNETKVINYTQKEKSSDALEKDYLTRYYSPSAIECYLNCPFKFFLKYVAKVDEGSQLLEEDLPMSHFGSLIHKVLERFSLEESRTEEDLERIRDEEYNSYFAEHIPETESSIKKYYSDFCDVLDNAYEMAEGDVCSLISEKDMKATHKSGINLHGIADLYVLKKDGKRVIIDYKIKNKVEHDETKLESIVQILLYAYILKKNGFRVDECEYRYLRQGEVVHILNLEERINDLNILLCDFKSKLEAEDFKDTFGSNSCKYCKYFSICAHNNGMEEEE